MNYFLNFAVRTLVAAANGRAKIVLGEQAVAQPPKTEKVENAEYRSNAGGWN